MKLHEIVGLEHHVVELDEAQILLALEPELDRILAQHAVDAEMTAIVAQERNVVQPVEPFGVVRKERVTLALAKSQELREGFPDSRDIGRDRFVIEELAGFILAGRIADLGRAAADQHDRAMAGLLQLPQHHDADEMPHMQARRRAVEADIAGDDLVAGKRIEPGLVGALVDVAAAGKLVEKI